MMLLPMAILMASIAGPVPAGARQPQMAAGQGKVVMTFGAGKAIYFTASADGGRSFSAPVKVADAGALALGHHRGPRVAMVPGAVVISAVTGEKPGSGELRAWRSVDGGRTWAPAGVINDTSGAAREGLHAMAADGRGNLFAVWLDLRARGTRLYGARSSDGGRRWGRNVEIYASPSGTICQCCDPSLAFDETGRVWVMWRNVVDGARDLYVTSSRDGAHFEAARKIGRGTWKLDACPMDGGGITAGDGGAITAWRRERAVYVARDMGPERMAGTGRDVAIAETAHGPFVAWSRGGGLEVLRPGAASAEPLAVNGSFVSLTALPEGGVLAAWETTNGIGMKRLD